MGRRKEPPLPPEGGDSRARIERRIEEIRQAFNAKVERMVAAPTDEFLSVVAEELRGHMSAIENLRIKLKLRAPRRGGPLPSGQDENRRLHRQWVAAMVRLGGHFTGPDAKSDRERVNAAFKRRGGNPDTVMKKLQRGAKACTDPGCPDPRCRR